MNLPDDLTELERELAARSRRQPSANHRPRVLSAVARELARSSTSDRPLLSPQRRFRQMLIAGGLAAAVAFAFIIWRLNGPTSVPSHHHIVLPPVAILSADDQLTTWRDCRQALDHSPDNLDQLLQAKSTRRTAHSPIPRTLLHANSELLTPRGDL